MTAQVLGLTVVVTLAVAQPWPHSPHSRLTVIKVTSLIAVEMVKGMSRVRVTSPMPLMGKVDVGGLNLKGQFREEVAVKAA